MYLLVGKQHDLRERNKFVGYIGIYVDINRRNIQPFKSMVWWLIISNKNLFNAFNGLVPENNLIYFQRLHNFFIER